MITINPIALITGLILSPIASVMAFLITYDEYQHHFPGKREPLNHAISAAVVTFAFFMIISLIMGLVMNSIVK